MLCGGQGQASCCLSEYPPEKYTTPFVLFCFVLEDRGERQGNPLEPYFFVIFIEKLNHIIMDSVQDRDWRPVRIAKECPPITHLIFTDDVFLFAEASLKLRLYSLVLIFFVTTLANVLM